MPVVINIYTASDVQLAITRAQVALLLISQRISSQFLYFAPVQYSHYKQLQYDIYCLFVTLTAEYDYMDFSAVPDTYEQDYYGLVGAMIEKTKQVDVFGAYNGSTNPYYQPPDGDVIIVNPVNFIPPTVIGWADFSTDDSPDGGQTRVKYYNTTWAGANPFMVLSSPADTGLLLGVDYGLVAGGGIQVINHDTNPLVGIGNGSGIIEGQILIVYNYGPA